MTKIENNTVARVHYTGTLPDSGEVFDSSEGREPLTFLVGHKQMIPGFERELMGAKVGDKVEFTLSAEDAYGEHNPGGVQKAPIAMFLSPVVWTFIAALPIPILFDAVVSSCIAPVPKATLLSP